MVVSALVKFVTFPLLLVNSLFYLKKSSKQFSIQQLLNLYFLVYLISLIFLVFLRELLPWYAIPLIGLASLSVDNKIIKTVTLGLSLGLLLKYIPFLYFGEWSVLGYQQFIIVLTLLVGLSLLYCFLRNKIPKISR